MSRKRKPYMSGRMEAAYHEVTGAVEVGSTVVLRGDPAKKGVVIAITKSNHGRGRPYAEIAWNDGRTLREPLGRIKVAPKEA